MLSDLRRLVGGEHVLDGAHAREELHDMTLLRGRADAVVRPGSAEEVAAVVAWCCERGVAIVPRGGGTGFAGGATPLGGGVVVALDRLDRVRAFEPLLWRAHVEAGVRTATVQRLARENGLVFPVDPGAAEQSQIGGNIATNAGGPHCFKYGVMRFWVLGLEAVLAPGELVRLGGAARKDVAGYDLTGLLCGSEGTLGIVTAAWLRLMPAPPVSLPVCGVFADAAAGAGAIERLLGSGVVPAAIEYLDAAAVRLAGGGFPGGLPDGGGFLVLAEADGSEDEARELAEALGPGVRRPEPAALWRWRDGVSHAVSAARGGKVSEDVAVPVDRLAEGVERTLEIGARHGLEACSWGHAGDGNLHSTFLVVPGDEDELRRADAAAEDLLEMAIELGGTITGEHGVGVRKNGFLSRQWAPAAVAAHRAVKAALDPHGVFNPGKKLP